MHRCSDQSSRTLRQRLPARPVDASPSLSSTEDRFALIDAAHACMEPSVPTRPAPHLPRNQYAAFASRLALACYEYCNRPRSGGRRLRAALLVARKERDTARVSALRSALSAIDNAETPRRGRISTGPASADDRRRRGRARRPPKSRGASCPTRRSATLLHAEVDERLAAAQQIERGGHTERAADPAGRGRGAQRPCSEMSDVRARLRLVQLLDVATASAEVGASSARLAKIARIADLLRRAGERGRRQAGRRRRVLAVRRAAAAADRRRLGGAALAAAAAAEPSLTVRDVDAAFSEIGEVVGQGIAGAPRRAGHRTVRPRPPTPSRRFCAACSAANCARARWPG